MPDDEKSRFDSRFDPAFQRGFEGRAAEVEPIAPSAARIVVPSPPPRAEEPEPLDLDAQDDEEDTDDDERTGPNPFLVALAVISVTLIAGGIYTAQTLSASYGRGDVITSLDYVTFNLVIYGVPIAVGLGVATGVGVLFMYAIGWNRGAVTRQQRRSRKNGA